MSDINLGGLRDSLAKAVGPSPWQWKTFPTVLSSRGDKFVWTHYGDQGVLAHLVTLNPEREPSRPLVALNTYCRPFLIDGSRFGVWCPEGRSLRVMCFDVDEMKPFDPAEVAGWFKQSGDRVYAATAPLAELETPLALSEGMNNIEVPHELRALDELIVPTSYPAKSHDDPAFALSVFYLQAGLLEVLPQRWFTNSQYEVGKQWITKAARDGQSHRIVGECFGVGNFLLQEDGCRLDRWLDKNG